jgi:hypothetical protein
VTLQILSEPTAGVDHQAVDRVGDRVDAHSVHATRFEATADAPSTGSFKTFQLPVQLPGPLACSVRRFQ